MASSPPPASSRGCPGRTDANRYCDGTLRLVVPFKGDDVALAAVHEGQRDDDESHGETDGTANRRGERNSCVEPDTGPPHHEKYEEHEVVVPAEIAGDEELERLFMRTVDDTRFAFEEILSSLEEKLADEPNALLRMKQARQAARAVLPNATESRIVVTGNLRAWRHFIGMRATEHADKEIRTLAVECLKILAKKCPVVFGDFEVATLSDGSEMATSPYVTDF